VIECVLCGSDQAVTWSTAGPLCRPCQDRRNAELSERIRDGTPYTQGVDPDGPPLPCLIDGCTRDATVVTRLWHGGEERWVCACDAHTDQMTAMVAWLREHPGHSAWK
jgi:hypothetical protein